MGWGGGGGGGGGGVPSCLDGSSCIILFRRFVCVYLRISPACLYHDMKKTAISAPALLREIFALVVANNNNNNNTPPQWKCYNMQNDHALINASCPILEISKLR